MHQTRKAARISEHHAMATLLTSFLRLAKTTGTGGSTRRVQPGAHFAQIWLVIRVWQLKPFPGFASTPVSCVVQVTEYLGAGARQFGFMLRGLKLLEPALKELNIPFFLLKGDPVNTIPKLVKDSGAGLLVVDQSPVRVARKWRQDVSLTGLCSSQ